jgi:hypothetical protein
MSSRTFVGVLAVILIVVLVLALTYKPKNVEPGVYQFRLLPMSLVVKPTVQDNIQGDREVRTLPESIDLFATSPTPSYVLDQGIWGSCTAFSTKYAYYFWMNRPGNTPLDMSPAFTYAQSRIAGNYGLSDVGSTNSSTVSVFKNIGVAPESLFPYWAKNIFINPSTVPGLLASAGHKCTFTSVPFSTNSATTLTRMKTALQTGGLVVGIVVFNSHMTTEALKTGAWGMPTNADLRAGPMGGHSICLTGYTGDKFTFHNSWGVYCGLGGAFTIPQAYFTTTTNGNPTYAFDMWTL